MNRSAASVSGLIAGDQRFGRMAAVAPAAAQLPGAGPARRRRRPTPHMPTLGQSTRAAKLKGDRRRRHSRRPPTSCRWRSSSCRRASRSKSMPAASRMRARCASATRAPCSSAIACSDKVYAIVDKDGKREVKVIASGLDRPNGLAFKDGTLYIAEGHANLEAGQHRGQSRQSAEAGRDLQRLSRTIKRTAGNSWRSAPTTSSMCNVGAPCNICIPPDANCQIRRSISTAPAPSPYVRGIRNSVGFDWNPDNPRSCTSPTTAATGCRRNCPRRAQPRHQDGREFRLPVLPPGQLSQIRPIGWGHSLQRFHAAGRPARAACRSARHAVLYRHHVSGEVPRRHLHRAARLLE